MEERSLFHRMRQIFREEGETEEVGSQANETDPQYCPLS